MNSSFNILSLTLLLIISISSSSAFTPVCQSHKRTLIGGSSSSSRTKRNASSTITTRTSTRTRTSSLSAAASSSAGGAKKKKATKKKAVATKKSKGSDDNGDDGDGVVTFRKPEFVSRIAEKTGMSKADSEAALSAVLETITEEVAAGKRISMLGFGTFKLTHRKARKGRNPKTGEPIDIAASNSPSFTAGKAFKERCNP